MCSWLSIRCHTHSFHNLNWLKSMAHKFCSQDSRKKTNCSSNTPQEPIMFAKKQNNLCRELRYCTVSSLRKLSCKNDILSLRSCNKRRSYKECNLVHLDLVTNSKNYRILSTQHQMNWRRISNSWWSYSDMLSICMGGKKCRKSTQKSIHSSSNPCNSKCCYTKNSSDRILRRWSIFAGDKRRSIADFCSPDRGMPSYQCTISSHNRRGGCNS